MSPRLASLAALIVCLVSACGSNHGDDDSSSDDDSADACVGLQCFQVDCTGQGIGTTRVSGTVYAPNGTLPLYNVTVYVPNSDPGPLTDGVTCDRCAAALPGNPVVQTTTDEAGHFNLDNVPVTGDIPLVIQVGKWRRQLTIPTVSQCADNPLDATSTSLPSNSSEGDMPRIAITTGDADALECLVRKLGVDDTEISTDAGAGKVHLYVGDGADEFDSTFANQGTFTNATTLWSDVDKLKTYDILILSCEGDWPSQDRAPAEARQAVFDFANAGGRVFLSHWHNYWMQFAPDPWPEIAEFRESQGDVHFDETVGTVNEGFDRGPSFATWLVNVGASVTRDLIEITQGRNTCTAVDENRAEKWLFLDPDSAPGNASGVQDLLFTTPNDAAEDQRCGKVVFSDMHVSSTSSSDPNVAYPGGCDTNDLTPQEKALAFIFFDIASCVGPIVD